MNLNYSIIFTVAGILIQSGILLGVYKTSMKNIKESVIKIEGTLEKFGCRLGKAEGKIETNKGVCEERHK